MFKVFVQKEVGGSNSFQEAFGLFFISVKDLLEKGTSWQILEKACWIECKDGSMGFYDCRDFALKIGLLKDGELVTAPIEISAETLRYKFMISKFKEGCESISSMI